MDFAVVIPARYQSSRLPGKPLADIGGKPMIAWVLEIANASGAAEVIVATDDGRIAKACDALGARVEMTGTGHASGTDRIAEVAGRLDWDSERIVVNLQGDEPGMPAVNVSQVARLLAEDEAADVGTLATPLTEASGWFDPSVAKVVLDQRGHALYFSRAGIPYDRDGSAPPEGALRHLGLYAYRVEALQRLTHAEVAPAEKLEQLEQLRALWLGMTIKVGLAEQVPPTGVDTEEDLIALRTLLADAET